MKLLSSLIFLLGFAATVQAQFGFNPVFTENKWRKQQTFQQGVIFLGSVTLSQPATAFASAPLEGDGSSGTPYTLTLCAEDEGYEISSGVWVCSALVSLGDSPGWTAPHTFTSSVTFKDALSVSGDVGIGTTSPGELFQVGSSGDSNASQLTGDTLLGEFSTSGVAFLSAGDRTSNEIHLQLRAQKANGVLVNVMRLTGLGLVGIGTEVPTSSLSVVGSVDITQSLDIGLNLTIAGTVDGIDIEAMAVSTGLNTSILAEVAVDTATHAGTVDAHFDHADNLTELNTQIGASIADGPHTSAGVTESQNPVSWTGAHTYSGSVTYKSPVLFESDLGIAGPNATILFNSFGGGNFGDVSSPLIFLDSQGSGVGFNTNGAADVKVVADGVSVAVFAGTGTVFVNQITLTSGDLNLLSGALSLDGAGGRVFFNVFGSDDFGEPSDPLIFLNSGVSGNGFFTNAGADVAIAADGISVVVFAGTGTVFNSQVTLESGDLTLLSGALSLDGSSGRVFFNVFGGNDFGSAGDPLINLDSGGSGVGLFTNGADDVSIAADGVSVAVFSSTGAVFTGNIDAVSFTGNGSELTSVASSTGIAANVTQLEAVAVDTTTLQGAVDAKVAQSEYDTFEADVNLSTAAVPAILTATKVVDETIVASTTRQEDDVLKVTVLANTTYHARVTLLINGDAAGGKKSGFRISDDGIEFVIKANEENTVGYIIFRDTTTFVGGAVPDATDHSIEYSGIVFGGPNGGIFGLDTAQSVASGSLSFLRGSHMTLIEAL